MTVVWLLLAACRRDDPAPGRADLLSATDRLVRASLALRGIRPSIDELDEIERHPDHLEVLVRGYVQAPEFGATIRELHEEVWQLDSSIASLALDGSLEGFDPARIRRSLSQAPTRLVERVVTSDQPYTQILAADHTMADEVVSRAWVGLDPVDGEAWRPAPWTDGRPAAGILADSWVWLAYRSAGANYNRGRANAVTKALVCVDFLESSPVPDTSVDLADAAAVTDAVANNPACVGCHRDLDPIGSFFFPMSAYPVLREETWPLAMYTPDATSWEVTTGRAPAWFGEPGADLADLGRSIAADPRFPDCTARRFVSFLEQVPLEEVDDARVERLSSAFVASGFDAKELAVAIVTSDEHARPDEVRTLRPEQLSRVMQDLTGFVWAADVADPCCGAVSGDLPYGHVVDLANDAFAGYRVLAGGVDAPNVTVPTHTVAPTVSLVLGTWAALAADHVVRVELLEGGARRLFTVADATTQDEGALRAELVQLHARMYGERLGPQDDEISHTLALWQAARELHGDVPSAWRTTLTAMLQDVRMVYW